MIYGRNVLLWKLECKKFLAREFSKRLIPCKIQVLNSEDMNTHRANVITCKYKNLHAGNGYIFLMTFSVITSKI